LFCKSGVGETDLQLSNWYQTGIITGFALLLLSIAIEPITHEKINTAGVFTTLIFPILISVLLVLDWFVNIEAPTLAMKVIFGIDLIVAVVS